VSGRCRLAGRALVVAVALLALPVMASSTANAVGEAQSLDLDPADGPPGATVTWVAEGFGDCPPVDDAVPGGVVAVEWDGTVELERASVRRIRRFGVHRPGVRTGRAPGGRDMRGRPGDVHRR
jgi:hypothetical protein